MMFRSDSFEGQASCNSGRYLFLISQSYLCIVVKSKTFNINVFPSTVGRVMWNTMSLSVCMFVAGQRPTIKVWPKVFAVEQSESINDFSKIFSLTFLVRERFYQIISFEEFKHQSDRLQLKKKHQLRDYT